MTMPIRRFLTMTLILTLLGTACGGRRSLEYCRRDIRCCYRDHSHVDPSVEL